MADVTVSVTLSEEAIACLNHIYDDFNAVLQQDANAHVARCLQSVANEAQKHYEDKGDSTIPTKREDLAANFFARSGYKTLAERNAAR